MTDLELIFTMLGEASTKTGGSIAKNARIELETQTVKRLKRRKRRASFLFCNPSTPAICYNC